MKIFVNNCIDLIRIIYYLQKTVLNCLVVVKTWQHDWSFIFKKVLKICAIIIFVNIADLRPLFCIRKPLPCCCSISFWGILLTLWQFPFLWMQTHCVKRIRIRSYSGPHFSRIFPHSDWIFSPNAGKCGKNAGQNNSEYGHILRSEHPIIIDNVSAKKRRSVWLNTIEFRLALVGIHVFSGNDSSFFKRSKEKMWENYWEISKTFNFLQNVRCQPIMTRRCLWRAARICLLCADAKVKSINNVRWKKFDQKLQHEYKVADLASLPPCNQVLLYHAKRDNLIAYMTYVK